MLWYLLSPLNAEKLSSSKMQSAWRGVNKSPVRGSRYFMIDGDLYPTYIPNFLWGPIIVCCGGEISTYTAQPNFRRWGILGWFPRTNCNGEAVWYAIGLIWMKSVACMTTWQQHDAGNLQFYSNGLAINFTLLIRDSANPFCLCTYQKNTNMCPGVV